MTVIEELYKYLSNNEAIRALIGDKGQRPEAKQGQCPNELSSKEQSSKVYPLIAPEEVEPPYIVYNKVSDIEEYTLEGKTGTGNKRLQISVYDSDIVKASEIASVICKEMDRWWEVEPLVQTVTKINQVELHDKERKLVQVAIDFMIYGQN